MPKPKPTVLSWPATVEAAIRQHWGESWTFPQFEITKGVQHVVRTVEQVRSDGIRDVIATRYPDFAERCAAVAALVAAVAQKLAKRGELADGEYAGLIREPLHRALPFLDATVREALARELVTMHAGQQS
jgi:hypothetical protein